MRKIGFGVTEREVKGHRYLYVWYYGKGERRQKCVGQDKVRALKMIRRLGEEARKDAINYIEEQVRRYQKILA